MNPHCNDAFVKQRITKNLSKQKPPVSEEEFWECLVACLLTTQQRSGPKSIVTQFIATRPFPLRYEVCMSHQDDLLDFARTNCLLILAVFVGRGKLPPELRPTWAHWRENGVGKRYSRCSTGFGKSRPRRLKRTVAHFIDERLCGFGPKQSRNLLQALGLTKYEIPIDSRVTKWLNDFGFPLKLSANALADPNYYEFVLDAVQQLCREADVVPCVLDAAIFSSFDGDGWAGVKNIW